jgi:hypothetical protein
MSGTKEHFSRSLAGWTLFLSFPGTSSLATITTYLSGGNRPHLSLPSHKLLDCFRLRPFGTRRSTVTQDAPALPTPRSASLPLDTRNSRLHKKHSGDDSRKDQPLQKERRYSLRWLGGSS